MRQWRLSQAHSRWCLLPPVRRSLAPCLQKFVSLTDRVLGVQVSDDRVLLPMARVGAAQCTCGYVLRWSNFSRTTCRDFMMLAPLGVSVTLLTFIHAVSLPLHSMTPCVWGLSSCKESTTLPVPWYCSTALFIGAKHQL